MGDATERQHHCLVRQRAQFVAQINITCADFAGLVHGLAAAVGLVLLIIAVVQMSSAGPAGVALAIFVIAALGGFVLFAMHVMKKTLPPVLIVVHGLLAVVAFVVLLVGLLRS